MRASYTLVDIHYTFMLRLNGQNRLYPKLVTIEFERESERARRKGTTSESRRQKRQPGQIAADGGSSPRTILSLLQATIDIIFTPLCFFILSSRVPEEGGVGWGCPTILVWPPFSVNEIIISIDRSNMLWSSHFATRTHLGDPHPI